MSYFYSHKSVFESLKSKDLHKLLQDILNEDYYLEDFSKDEMHFLLLETLESYNIVFVSNKENRVLLTQMGENVLYSLNEKLI